MATDGFIALASGTMEPHPLVPAWRTDQTRAGIGFGVERLLVAAQGTANLKQMGRRLAYLNSIRLSI